jgi:hypothetical protein
MGRTIESLVESRTGRNGGTWVRPRVAINLAQWCSPEFAVLVTGWVLELLTHGTVTVHHTQPVTLAPYTVRVAEMPAVRAAVPANHWCVFIEAAPFLITAERIFTPAGLEMKSEDLIDGSIGRKYSDHRRGHNWASAETRYNYTFPAGKRQGVVVRPLAYPYSELEHFHRWLWSDYARCHFWAYMNAKYRGRCHLAIPHIRRELPQALPGGGA